MKKWKKIKKSWLVAAATGALVVGAGIVILVNASGLHAIFEPKDYENFENQYENNRDYDSAAGDGEESDLADENEDGQSSGEEDTQKALKVAQEEPKNWNDADALGMAEDRDYEDDSGQERNPNAFELSDDRGAGGIDVRPDGGKNGDGGGNAGGSAPGSGAGTGSPTVPANPNPTDTQTPTKVPDPAKIPESTKTPEPTKGPDATQIPEQKPDPTSEPEITPTPGPTERPEVPDVPTPTATPATWENNQLKPRDPVVTGDGELVKLSAVINRKYYQGDVFQSEDAQVTATFLQTNGAKKDVQLSYGGTDGYSVRLSTKAVGTYTATFTYLKVTARAAYEVISSGVSVRYHGERDGEIFAINFPGPLGGDEETMDTLSVREFHATSGGKVDLTDIHRRMIAYLGDRQIQKNFLDNVSYQNTAFLEEKDGYLTNMLCGFRYFANGNLEENGPYLYYPVYNWGANNMRNVVNAVGDVPDGYKIRRSVQDEDALEKYRADQVLEQYVGNDAVLSVPMGVTKVVLKGRQGNGDVTSMALPESVREIDFASVSKCLPALQSYESSGHGVYQASGGVLYSSDKKKLVSVPAGRMQMQMQIPDTVTVIGKDAFKNSRVRELELPETVKTLEAGCFDGLQAEVIRIKGKRAPEIIADAGYRGKVLFPDSDFDVLLKEGMFAFKSQDIVFGAMDEKGAEILEKTGIYRYDLRRHILTYESQPEKLAGIPMDAYGRYVVPEGITAIGAGVFAKAQGLWEVDLPGTVTELEEGSLIFPENVVEIFLAADNTEISPRALGSLDSGEALKIKVYVAEEAYDGYLRRWSQALDPVYGEGTAARLLQVDDGAYFYENQARYKKIVENQQTSYRLMKVYAQDKTAFQVKDKTSVIEAEAFALCGSLEIVWLPDTLEKVEDGAFNGCISLQTVTVTSAELLSEKAFGGQAADVKIYEKGSRFKEFIYDAGLVYGRMADGSYTLLDVPTDCASKVTLYENTSCLNEAAFKDCTQLEDLDIPDPEALTEIGAGCFENCRSVRQMRLDGAIHLKKAGAEAFRACERLEALYLPDSLRKAEKGLCYGCTSLQTVRAAGLGQVEEEMFFNCQSLLSNELLLDWEGITAVGSRAFAHCSMLTVVPDMPKLKSLGDQAFYTCQRLRRIALPETLTAMGEECFGECSLMTQVTMNGKLTGISRYCFYGCRALVRVEFSQRQKEALQVVGVQAFGQCASLESLDLSEFPALRQMGERTFAGCDFLTTVRLPQNLSKVPDYCFENCPNLSILALFSDKVTEPGQAIFGDTRSPFINLWVKEENLPAYKKVYEKILDSLYGTGTTEAILGKIDEKKEIIRGITFEITEEGRVLKEASEAFEGHYTVPVHTVRIASEAFMNCTKLTGIEFPQESVISLEDRCFKGCSSLKTVALYGHIPQWGEEVFMGCVSLEMAEIGGNRPAVIHKVGDRAFKGCTGLTGRSSVTIRASVSVLGEECFAGCVNLEAIPSSESFRSAVEAVEDRAFEGCKALSQFMTSAFTSLKTVGAYAFSNCDSLVNPSVPANVTSIGEGAFAECDRLSTVSFYCVLEEYPRDCFKNCPKLTRTGGVSAALSGLRRIGESAYEGCVSLTANDAWNLGRYSGLEEIGSRAFNGCVNMESIHLTSFVQNIGEAAFDGCVKAGQMVFDAEKPPRIGGISLDTMSPDFCIRVPDSQAQGDRIYKAYLDVFTEMFGSGQAYERLDSVSDGAKERNGQAVSADKISTVSSGQEEKTLQETGRPQAAKEAKRQEEEDKKERADKETAGAETEDEETRESEAEDMQTDSPEIENSTTENGGTENGQAKGEETQSSEIAGDEPE